MDTAPVLGFAAVKEGSPISSLEALFKLLGF
jgi:hypothetical protein